jgi:hypothetical protein
MKIRRYIAIVLAFVFLTFLTQVGGLVLLMCLPIYNWVNRAIVKKYYKLGLKMLAYAVIYSLVTFVIVPPLAQEFGRVPMPYFKDSPFVKPHNFFTVLANRHYVKPSLRQITEGVAQKIAERYKDSIAMRYLDCCFPFWDGFPLAPHLSHNDGRKIDIAFYYTKTIDNQPVSDSPSWLGYGVCEEPRAGEENQPEFCREKGEWQYSFMRKYIIPQYQKPNFKFDADKTTDMLRFFSADNRVRFALIEPHLKTRLGFSKNTKVRIPPCIAVRHDDHIHIIVD